MTAISLFDALASTTDNATHSSERTGQLAARLVESSLADWQRVREYELEFSPTRLDDLRAVAEIDRSIHALYSQWMTEAAEVYARGKQISNGGHAVPRIDDLADAIGRTGARLLATPEQLVVAVEHVSKGETTPAKELRDELNARLRARR